MLKRYTQFTESKKNSDYSIYYWFEDLKRHRWDNSIKENDLKHWAEHFIGVGYYNKISNRVDEILGSLEKLDTDNVYSRLYDVLDELPFGKKIFVRRVVAYCDYDNYDYDINGRYNGMLGMGDKYNDNKLSLMISMLITIVQPTLYMSVLSTDILVRTTESQKLVTREEFNCSNFKILDYLNQMSKHLTTSDEHLLHSSRKVQKYSLDKIIGLCFTPCLLIDIGGYEDSYRTGKFDLNRIEELLDDALLSILPEIDDNHVIWDKSRGTRQFDTTDFYDYTLKILLN